MTTIEGNRGRRLAVVTGGANGIGAAICRRLLASNIDVASIDLVANNEQPSVTRGAATVTSFISDVTDAALTNEVCADILARLGAPDILVNNAGGSGAEPVPEIEHVSDKLWQDIFDLNVTSSMRFSRAFADGMREKGFGRIINMSSTVRYGVPGALTTLNARIPYVVAKAALVGLTRQLAKDLGPHGITVNAVAPGMILPGPGARLTRKFESLPRDVQQRITASSALGRTGTGEDIAAVVNFLASDEAEYVSGEIINARGG